MIYPWYAGKSIHYSLFWCVCTRSEVFTTQFQEQEGVQSTTTGAFRVFLTPTGPLLNTYHHQVQCEEHVINHSRKHSQRSTMFKNGNIHEQRQHAVTAPARLRGSPQREAGAAGPCPSPPSAARSLRTSPRRPLRAPGKTGPPQGRRKVLALARSASVRRTICTI